MFSTQTFSTGISSFFNLSLLSKSTAAVNYRIELAFLRRPFSDLTLVKEPLANLTKSYSGQVVGVVPGYLAGDL